MASDDETKKKLIKMRARSTRVFPFLADLIYSIDIQLTDKPNSYTDGKKIVISVENETKKEISRIWLEFACLHETLHIALQHLTRFKAYEPSPADHLLLNFLTDSTINELIIDEMTTQSLCDITEKDFIKENYVTRQSIEKFLDKLLTKEWRKDPYVVSRTDPGFEHISDSFKALRQYIRKEYQKPQTIAITFGGNDNSAGKGTKEPPGIMEAPGKLGSGITEQEIKDAEKETQRKILGGIMGGMMRGKGKGKLENILGEMWSKSRVDWKRMLINHIRTRLRGSRTWQCFHKKSHCTPCLIPGFNKKSEYSLMVAVDVSGSVSDKQVHDFLSEVFWLMKKHKARVEYLTFDDGIQMKTTLKTLADIERCRKITGRGGTSYKEVIEHAIKTKTKDLVIVTDGYGDQDSITPPGLRVWWIVDNDHVAFPFGKKVKIDDNAN